jgi:hypothetical protein
LIAVVSTPMNLSLMTEAPAFHAQSDAVVTTHAPPARSIDV